MRYLEDPKLLDRGSRGAGPVVWGTGGMSQKPEDIHLPKVTHGPFVREIVLKIGTQHR